MPARIELAVPLDADLRGPHLELVQLGQRLAHLLGGTDQPDQVVHALLELLVQRVRVLAALDVERRERGRRGRVDLVLPDGRVAATEARYVLGRADPRAASEDEQVRQRVAAETVRAVHATRDLAGREKARHAGGCL